MYISLLRYSHRSDSTGGMLFIDGIFFCYTCEDQAQPIGVKIPGETRIPSGHYNVLLRNEGGMTQKYANKFPDIHQGMLWLQNVPGFKWVYIHIGNDDDDTLGCVLVGEVPGRADNKEAIVYSSTNAYKRLYTRIIDAINDSESVVIDIRDITL